MSLHKAAKYLESKGRNGDSMLVHMTPGEVKSLQTLAKASGGSLSVNPRTGLVEASYLKNLLPVIAGAALNFFAPGVGTAIGSALGGLSGAAGTGILIGGAEALRTGDIGRGVTAGLGGFGGAGLAGAGAGTAGGATGATGAGATGSTGGVGISAGSPGALGPGTAATPGASGYLGTGGTEMVTGINPSATPGITSSTPLYTPNITPSAGTEGMGKYLMAAAAPTISDVMTPKVAMPSTPEEEERYKGSPYRYNLSSNFQGYSPTTPNPYYRPSGLGYAEGGDVMLAAGGSYDDEPMGDTPAMAMGGSIGGYSDGGRMLKGPGDGMSDSIPAVIGKRQPARLADGEFVVPADVVSHLGNGSTDAGAKRLYSMMDKVRTARTGKKKQAKAIKADKYMPA